MKDTSKCRKSLIRSLLRGETSPLSHSTCRRNDAQHSGTLYPLLSRLETNGLVETEWREGDGGLSSKYFLLSDDGHAEYASQAAQWHAFCAHTVDFITLTPEA
ncbi:Transcriptional regulator PadR-like family protein [Austwickia chelonae]|uniref:PadR family transcriptional regulator n=1 Tax=Austwickia chelonae TaxID=100225 RepID=UPI0002EF49C0|nr:PadR family transcriptional regulator [Austwickia chelonae]SEW40804.1 Transcriptional regulator PadR-like family protein [Austwickia chelonae]